MQVILGAGGAIGNDLALELKNYTDKIRLFSRNPKKVNSDDELFAGDLTHPESVEKAVKGADVAYLTAGLPYRITVWRKLWPEIMQNVISACEKNKTRLVFFDNIYMYNENQLSPMTEESEVRPSSRKGKVRETIAKMLMDEVKSGKIDALIARAADFYGPGIRNSMFNEMIVNKLKAGKKAIWFCSAGYKHNFTFTPDAARATALLGNSSNAWGQVWHLPTVPPLKMNKWIEATAAGTGTKPKTMIIPSFMVKTMGFIDPLMNEMAEMLYQYNRDYDFDSSKFETVFKQNPTPVDEAIKQIVQTG